MAEVSIMVHGRTYGVGCDGGQEKRVRELGQYIDKKVKEIAAVGGAATEAHLLVLANLVLADELFEEREQIQQLRNQIAVQIKEMQALEQSLTQQSAATDRLTTRVEELQSRVGTSASTEAIDPEIESRLCLTIDNIATRLESMTERLMAA